jgi:hypothetical protein
MRARATKATAYHEAGHAVATWYAGEGLYHVHVASGRKPEVFVDRRGREVFAIGLTEASGGYNPGTYPPPAEAFASPSAHADYLAKVLPSIRQTAVISMAVNMAGPLAEARGSRISGTGAWLRAVDDRAHWTDTVCEFPEGERAAMKAQAERSAVLIVRAGWKAIEALAHELRARGSMPGEDAGTVIAAAWPTVVAIEGAVARPWRRFADATR